MKQARKYGVNKGIELEVTKEVKTIAITCLLFRVNSTSNTLVYRLEAIRELINRSNCGSKLSRSVLKKLESHEDIIISNFTKIIEKKFLIQQ